jgi:putative phosphoribosyl transferase
VDSEVRIPAGGLEIAGDLNLPPGPDPPRAVVVFAHGSASSRLSPQDHQIGVTLRGQSLATLLVDLLTAEEAAHAERSGRTDMRFDIPLLARRLVAAVDWLRAQPATRGLPVGLFGSGTGTAVALVAAARQPERVGAVVSRAGRPDLAAVALAAVRAPTLLLVGDRAPAVAELNRRAAQRLGGGYELEMVPGAGPELAEPDGLAAVAARAGTWYARWLDPPHGRH